jgi:hypothetical protein
VYLQNLFHQTIYGVRLDNIDQIDQIKKYLKEKNTEKMFVCCQASAGPT